MAVISSHNIYKLRLIVSEITTSLPLPLPLILLISHKILQFSFAEASMDLLPLILLISHTILQFSLAEASMESELGPKIAQKIFEGEGGFSYSWLSAEFPILSQAKVGAGKLVLNPLGLALPHYADSSKVAIVLQGKGRIGIIFPKASEQKVVEIEEGDIIPVPLAAVSWWFNDGDSKLIVIFLGDTSKAHSPGDFTYFLLAGAKGIFTGFSNNFVSGACDLDEEDTNKLVNSQSGVLIIKLKEGTNMPQPSKADKQEVVFNIEATLPDVYVENGGKLVVLSREKFPLLEEVGLSVKHVRLDANAMFAPEFSSDPAVQVIYIVEGSGRVEVVGIDSESVLNTTVKDGDLFVVPIVFVVSTVAGNEGMEWFSMTTSTQPFFKYLVGKTSLWKTLSPQVLQVTLNLTTEEAEVFSSKMNKNPILIPPPM
ncbi:glutelin type-D 1-like [Macadamia integrifolia]|uniref:glutelin type-D 1-like n=1 Tax=Macadamia integrifolia TaxID=60698 RepID=UPI001C4F74D9|nr:glutelin type-D 1-like [Macadamia integrifolia]